MDAERLAERMLAEAYDYVLSGWCQGTPAQDECGRPIEPASAFARKWSALGALERAWLRAPEEPLLARTAHERAKLALIAAANDVPASWNDAPERHQSEVLSAIAQALQLVEAAPGPLGPSPLEELVEDVDQVGHHWAVRDAIFESGASGPAGGPIRVVET